MTTGGLDPTPPDPGARVNVEAIRKRADAAPPGPYVAHADDTRVYAPAPPKGERVWLAEVYAWGQPGDPRAAVARFFAHARTDVPALCDALEHERRVSAAWRALWSAQRAQANEWLGWREKERLLEAALDDLRALGIDPEAP